MNLYKVFYAKKEKEGGEYLSKNEEFLSIDDKEARDYVKEEIVGGYVNEYSIEIYKIGEQISFTCSD